MFSNYFPSSTGEINIYGDSSLDFGAATYLTVKSANSVNLSTLGTNSDIFITTDSYSSSVNFHSLGNFVSTSTNEVEFITTGAMTFTSYDNTGGDVDNGKITLFSPNDISSVTDSLYVEGSMGVTLATINRADITLQSYGTFTIQNYDTMIFNATAGKLSIAATEDVLFSTYKGREGDIDINTSRDLLITANDHVQFIYGDDWAVTAAQTIQYKGVGTAGFRFVTEGQDSVIDFTADIIRVTSGDKLYLDGGNVIFTSTGTSLLNAGRNINVNTHANHGHIFLESAQQLLVQTGNSFTFGAVTGYELNYDLGTSYFYGVPGHSYINFTADGINPQFGYGVSINTTNSLIASNGKVIFYSDSDTVNLKVRNTAFFETYTTSNVKNSLRISSLGTNSQATFNTTQNILINSYNRVTTYASESVQFFPYKLLSFSSSAEADVDSDYSMDIRSTHPNADIVMLTTDFLTGSVQYNSISETNVYAERGINFHLEDDDDSNPSGEFQVNGNYVNLEAQNSVNVQSVGGGDIVLSATGSYLHIHAGDDMYFSVKEQFEMADADLVIDTPGQLRFTASQSSITQYTTSTTIISPSGDVFMNSLVDLSVSSQGSASFTASEDYSYSDFDIVATFEMNAQAPAVNIETDSSFGVVDFVDGLVIPSFNFNGDTLGDLCGLNFEFSYDTTNNQFVYCFDSHMYTLQTDEVIFPY